jgi:hypothetical protein
MQKLKRLEQTVAPVFLALTFGILGWAAPGEVNCAAPALEEQQPTVYARRAPTPAVSVRAEIHEELASTCLLRVRLLNPQKPPEVRPLSPTRAGKSLLNFIGLRRE